MLSVKLVNIIPVLAAVLLLSCNKSMDSAEADGVVIRLSAGVEVTKAVPDDQIPDAGVVGVFINEDSPTPQYVYSQNMQYIADGAGNLTTQTSQYYPQNGNLVTISAYYPYSANGTSAFEFSVKADQSLDADHFASDLLHSPVQNVNRSNSSVNLQFTHKLSKITYQLVAGSGAPDISSALVTFLDLKHTVNFNPLTGSLTPASSAAVSVIPNPNNGAIIVPQTIPMATQFISVQAQGFMYYFKTPSAYTFQEGKSYHYIITVNKTGITVTLSDITIWGGTTAVPETGSTHTYSIGDYYPDPNNKSTAIGIIFQLFEGGVHGKILCKDRQLTTQYRWAAEGSQYVNLLIGANDLDNGINNRNVITSIPDWGNNFPAFGYWVIYGTDWYIPSKNELLALCAGYSGLNYGEDVSEWPDGTPMPNFDAPSCQAARTEFNKRITGLGNGDVMGAVIYLSSSEASATEVHALQFSTGITELQLKNDGINAYGTRAIKAF